MVGYKFWITYLENKADTTLEAILDSDQYKEADLIKLSLPINNPYQNDWSDYKRVNGEISFDGKIYHYVKEKVEFGQLILLCLPDHEKMKLEAGLSSRHQPTKAILTATQDECIPVFSWKLGKITALTTSHTFNPYHADLNSSFHLTIERPPDLLPS